MREFSKEQLTKVVFGKPKRSLAVDMTNLLFIFFIAVFVVFIAFSQVYTGISISGSSMMPTLNKYYFENPNKEDIAYYVKADKFNYGDIVIVEMGDKQIIKRVIGLPGDYIEIKKDVDSNYYVFRNGEKLVEIYAQAGMAIQFETFLLNHDGHLEVGTQELFVLGDNRGYSRDSSEYGCFDYSQILGRVDFVVEADEIPVVDLFIQLFFPIFR